MPAWPTGPSTIGEAQSWPRSVVVVVISLTSRMTRWRSVTAASRDTFACSVTWSYEPPCRYSERKCGRRLRAIFR